MYERQNMSRSFWLRSLRRPSSSPLDDFRPDLSKRRILASQCWLSDSFPSKLPHSFLAFCPRSVHHGIAVLSRWANSVAPTGCTRERFLACLLRPGCPCRMPECKSVTNSFAPRKCFHAWVNCSAVSGPKFTAF